MLIGQLSTLLWQPYDLFVLLVYISKSIFFYKNETLIETMFKLLNSFCQQLRLVESYIYINTLIYFEISLRVLIFVTVALKTFKSLFTSQ